MKMALEDAAFLMNDSEMAKVNVGYINAHATSTPKGDDIEAMVIDRVLRSYFMTKGEDLSGVPYVSSTKGATGHLLGAAGALEASFTVMSLVDQRIPPTLNLENIDSNATVDTSVMPCFHHVQGPSIRPSSELQAAISNSFGFGGTNASILFCKYSEQR